MAGSTHPLDGHWTPLSQATGYGVVIGLGFAFAFGMIFTTFVLKRYNYEVQTSEMFSTAGRTVKKGLVASAVISSWTWAATLLQSAAVTYRYGVSATVWYAAGATVQIILFATLAIELKRRAPNAHTFLEVIRARYGAITHIVFMGFALMTNILVTAQLLAGGSAVVTTLTGVPTAAACFLLPIGVVLYTMFGGIKATFLTDYAHTVVILVIILIFAFTTYATSEHLGSPGKVYDLLEQASRMHPVEGNAGGSYLTFRSTEGAIFFVINLIGNFGTVFMDNGYYQKAIAASPVHALPGYVMGGLTWFAIPWLASTTMGLAALALENNPIFPSYPNRLPADQVTAGLVFPNAAVALLGSGGAAATLILLFMAVTSAMSAQLIAVSSIFTYDVYQTYMNPKATGKQLIYMSHATVIGFAVAMASFATGLYYIGISLGYLYLLMGVIISSAVVPAALTLLWSRQNWAAATFSPPLGLACSLIAWLVQAKSEFGVLTVDSTGSNYPMLAGNVVALLSPAIFVPILTFALPHTKYDFLSMQDIRRGDDSDVATAANVDLEKVPGANAARAEADAAAEKAKLDKSAKISRWLTLAFFLVFIVIWPWPMFGTSYKFSKGFFTGWVVVAFIWIFITTFCIALYPLWEGRKTMARTFKAMVKDLKGQRPAVGKATEGRGMDSDDSETGSQSETSGADVKKDGDGVRGL